MYIVCPHCTTSYAIDLKTLGAGGRTVRCSRCRETWHARPQDAVEAVVAMAGAEDAAADAGFAERWNSQGTEQSTEKESSTPVLDSPSIAADWPQEQEATAEPEEEFAGAYRPGRPALAHAHQSWFIRLFRHSSPQAPRRPRSSQIGLPVACTAMGALALALVMWRADMVRLLPQTASFYRMIGLEVNLRGLAFKDVKLASETMEGKPVLVVEGVIVGQKKGPIEIPRLRFSVRDAQGAEIYAWNAVLEQTVLKPGERAVFKSRLASPPPEGRQIEIRFFNRRDLAAGAA